jgi:hypothetical protein
MQPLMQTHHTMEIAAQRGNFPQTLSCPHVAPRAILSQIVSPVPPGPLDCYANSLSTNLSLLKPQAESTAEFDAL